MADPEAPPAGKAVGLRQNGDERFAQNGVHLDPFRAVAVAEECEVERAVQKGGNLGGRDHFPEAEFHLGIAPAVRLDGCRQFRKHDGAAEADRESALLSAAEASDLGEIVLNLVERAAGPLGKETAGESQSHAPGRAVEEAMAHQFFETSDLLAERRLSDAQAIRRPAEVQVLRNREKVAEVTKFDPIIHIDPISIYIF
jgi:hypothetical protein